MSAGISLNPRIEAFMHNSWELDLPPPSRRPPSFPSAFFSLSFVHSFIFASSRALTFSFSASFFILPPSSPSSPFRRLLNRKLLGFHPRVSSTVVVGARTRAKFIASSESTASTPTRVHRARFSWSTFTAASGNLSDTRILRPLAGAQCTTAARQRRARR